MSALSEFAMQIWGDALGDGMTRQEALEWASAWWQFDGTPAVSLVNEGARTYLDIAAALRGDGSDELEIGGEG